MNLYMNIMSLDTKDGETFATTLGNSQVLSLYVKRKRKHLMGSFLSIFNLLLVNT